MATLQIPRGSKILSKSLYLAQLSRYKHFCVLQFLRKIRKFKMAAIFSETKFFLKIGMATLQRYPVGQKFRQNPSHGFQDISIFVFCNFCEKFKNSKRPPILVRQNFFLKIGMATLQRYPVSKISLKSLYIARFSRYKHFCVLQFLQKNPKIQNGCHF